MAAKEMRIEPACIHRCRLVLETLVRGVCIASPLQGTLACQAYPRPQQVERHRPVPLQYLHTLAGCYARTCGESIFHVGPEARLLFRNSFWGSANCKGN